MTEGTPIETGNNLINRINYLGEHVGLVLKGNEQLVPVMEEMFDRSGAAIRIPQEWELFQISGEEGVLQGQFVLRQENRFDIVLGRVPGTPDDKQGLGYQLIMSNHSGTSKVRPSEINSLTHAQQTAARLTDAMGCDLWDAAVEYTFVGMNLVDLDKGAIWDLARLYGLRKEIVHVPQVATNRYFESFIYAIARYLPNWELVKTSEELRKRFREVVQEDLVELNR